MKAVILAAGKGSRLNPLTVTRPKHMLPIAGKPVLEHIVQGLRDADVREIGLVVHHIKEKIIGYFGDGSKWGVEITYIEQPKPEGTAAAVEVAADYVGDEPFLLVHGDVTVTGPILRELINIFERNSADAVVLGTEVPNPQEYGVLDVDGNPIGRLLGVIEKPRGRVRSRVINAGAFVFTPRIFEYVSRVGYSSRGERELTEALRMMASEREVLVYNAGSGWWFDVGRPWDLIDANKYFLSKIETKIKGEIHPGATILGPVVLEEGSVIMSGAVLVGPLYIGRGTRIEYNTVIGPYTSIGRDVVIGPLSYVVGSVILDNTRVSSHCSIFESIIGESVYLESGVKIPGYNIYGTTVKVLIKGRKIDSGREVLGAIIGDEVRIGANSSILPGITVMPRSIIDPGSAVREDVLGDGSGGDTSP